MPLLHLSAASVKTEAPPPSRPDDKAVDGRNQPQQHVDQINPDSVLHTFLTTLFGCRMIRDIDLAKGSEESNPQDTGTVIVSVHTTHDLGSGQLTREQSPMPRTRRI